MNNYMTIKWNLEEMDRFLEKFNLPRLDQEEIEIRNKPIARTEIEALIKNLPKNKNPGPDCFTGEFFFQFYFIYLFVLLYNIVLVLPYIDLNPPWVYMCSPF